MVFIIDIRMREDQRDLGMQVGLIGWWVLFKDKWSGIHWIEELNLLCCTDSQQVPLTVPTNSLISLKSFIFFSSVHFSRSVVSNSLRPHESQHARPSCPSPTPGVHSDSRPSSQWCHPDISSSVVPFSSCPHSLPATAAAAAAKSLQSCPTLCDPIDSSPPGSPVPGILQARTLEWVTISFSNAWKWKVKVKSHRVFSNESTLRMRWPKYWSFSFSISPSKDIPGLISFRMD